MIVNEIASITPDIIQSMPVLVLSSKTKWQLWAFLGKHRFFSVVMEFVGDIWPDARTAPDWSKFCLCRTSLHVYGKREARIGRKMGHVSFLGIDQEEILQKVNKAREFLNLPKL